MELRDGARIDLFLPSVVGHRHGEAHGIVFEDGHAEAKHRDLLGYRDFVLEADTAVAVKPLPQLGLAWREEAGREPARPEQSAGRSRRSEVGHARRCRIGGARGKELDVIELDVALTALREMKEERPKAGARGMPAVDGRFGDELVDVEFAVGDCLERRHVDLRSQAPGREVGPAPAHVDCRCPTNLQAESDGADGVVRNPGRASADDVIPVGEAHLQNAIFEDGLALGSAGLVCTPVEIECALDRGDARSSRRSSLDCRRRQMLVQTVVLAVPGAGTERTQRRIRVEGRGALAERFRARDEIISGAPEVAEISRWPSREERSRDDEQCRRDEQ